jgi:CIC family chloride channel protein
MHSTSERGRAEGARWRAINLAALRLFLRLAPSERQRVFALTIVIGALCGLAAVAFHLAIQAAEGALIERSMAAPGTSWMFWTILTPTLGGLFSGALLSYVVPDARGSGIPQVKVAYGVKGGRMPIRVAIGKFVIGVIQIGSGASLGREGPTVQICAGIASGLGQLAALSRQNLRRLLPVGAAAGIAAAFNAPIAAVTFTIEEVVGDLDQTVLTGVVVAAALAAAIERIVLGEHPVFTIPTGYGLHHLESLLLYALLGVAGALVALLFTESLIALRARFQRMAAVPAWARPAVGGCVTGLLAVAALWWLKTDGVTGGGYDTLSQALGGQLAVHVMLALCLMKLAATVFSYSSGGAGGIFAPALFIGGMLGGAFGYGDVMLFHHDASEIGAFALVGMGAVFAGIIRAPITSVLIIFEMTGGYGLILPLMIANMTAYGLARRIRPTPIYEALLEQDGVQLPHRQGPAPHALEQIQVGEAMTRTPVALPGTLTVKQALERSAAEPYSSFPVVDAAGQFVGLISEARLRRSQAEQLSDQPIAALADRRAALFPDQPLVDAVMLLDQLETRQIAVVERANPSHLTGLLSLSDVVRAQAQAARVAGSRAQPAGDLSEVKETLSDQPAFRRLPAFPREGQAAPAAPTTEPHYHSVLLSPDASAIGQPLHALDLPAGVLLVTIERAGQTLIPHGETVLAAGDRVTLFAEPHQIHGALAALSGIAAGDEKARPGTVDSAAG